MATILVDTDVWSFVTSSNPKRGKPYKPYLDGHTTALSFVTVGEQYAGIIKKIAKGDWNASHLEKFGNNIVDKIKAGRYHWYGVTG